eukprot:589709_1
MGAETLQHHKEHRKPQAGRKAERKKKKKPDSSVRDPNHKNAKAFSFKSAVRAAKSRQRIADREHKKHHVPAVNRTTEECTTPPVLIAVVGPPGVGKTSVIKSLVKHYTKHNLSEVSGPITVVAGKIRRLTFVECPNDLNGMIDMAKTADLVLMLVNGHFGFEMETFEFLNVAQVHGFPKVMGVLTHLDKFKKMKQLQAAKRTLKTRFQTEIYAGAKLFYFSGIKYGKYLKNEVHNLARFISVMKFRPLQWRNTHPYLIADRFEDLTDPALVQQNSNVDRTLSFYGYVRGTHLKQGMRLHLMGVGDFDMDNSTELDDPCPPPAAKKGEKRRRISEREKRLFAPMADVGDMMYDQDAVYINIKDHQVNFTDPSKAAKPEEEGEEKKAETERKKVVATQGPGESMVRSLQKLSSGLDEKMGSSTMRLLPESADLSSRQMDDERKTSSALSKDELQARPSDIYERMITREVTDEDGAVRRKVFFTDDVKEGSDDESDSSDEEVSDLENDSSNDSDESESDSGSDDSNSESDSVNDIEMGVADETDSKVKEQKEDGSQSADDALGAMSLRWKDNIQKKASQAFASKKSLTQLIYGEGEKKSSTNQESDDDGSSSDDDFFRVRRVTRTDRAINDTDSVRVHFRDHSTTHSGGFGDTVEHGPLDSRDWNDESVIESIRNRFVTGDWNAENKFSESMENDGDFGNLGGEMPNEDATGDVSDDLAEEEDHGITVEDDAANSSELPEETRARLQREKSTLKAAFDSQYDAEAGGGDGDAGSVYLDELSKQMSEQGKRNQEEFDGMDDWSRTQHRGYLPGTYVRVQLSGVPCEFVQRFDLKVPIVLGGLQAQECNLAFMQVRIKKHRWHQRILKTNDPLIFSIGWRRFQSMPVFSVSDQNERLRMIKYTPEHMHCIATFYGPVTPQGTGVVAYMNMRSDQPTFRVSATGVITEIDSSVKIVKKLKLTGVPYKIKKHTVFCKDMFSSSLEVSKFEGASIRTVSGIRGQIKKAVTTGGGNEGCFRASFEDKLLMSDIIFLRAWAAVHPEKYYNPLSTRLAGKEGVQLMKTVGQLRFERKMGVPHKKDSAYPAHIERAPKRFAPLKIPRALQRDLPFSSKPKLEKKRKKLTFEQKRPKVIDKEESRQRRLIRDLNTIRNVSLAKQKEKEAEKKRKNQKIVAREQRQHEEREKASRKRRYMKEGQREAKRQKRADKRG